MATTIGLVACSGDLDPDDAGPIGKTVSQGGGFVTSDDGVLTIVFPPASLSEPTLVTIESTVDVPDSIGTAYRVTPNVNLDVPAVVAYRYSISSLDGRSPDELTIGRLGGVRWDFLEDPALDTLTQQVSGEDAQISFAYGLLADTAGGGGSDDSGTGGSGSTTGGSDSDDDGTDDTDGTDGTDGTGGGPVTCGDGIVQTGELCLDAGEVLTVPSAPTAVSTADLDGDANLDLVVAGSASNDVTVLLGLGDGTFGPPEVLVVGAAPSAVEVLDVTGDGNLDLVVAESGPNTVSVYPGDGLGLFGAPLPFMVGAAPRSLVLGDFDQDGIDDVVSGDSGPGRVSLLLGDGSTLLPAGDFDLAAELSGIASGHFNSDDYLDIVGVSPMGTTIVLGNGAGLFGGPFTTPLAGTSSGVAVLDADEDGLADLAATQSDLNTVTLVAGGAGTGGVPFATGLGPVAVSAADMDTDERTDLVVVDGADNTVTILRGGGTGDFATITTLAVGVGPTALTIGDFNGDGAPDIAVSAGDDSVSILVSDN